MQKLDQTEDNLTRVEDILFDLEGRVEPLREEAAIAKEYKHLSSEMEKVMCWSLFMILDNIIKIFMN